MRRGSGRCGPEERIIVWEEGEEDSEEEGGCCGVNDLASGLELLS